MTDPTANGASAVNTDFHDLGRTLHDDLSKLKSTGFNRHVLDSAKAKISVLLLKPSFFLIFAR